MTVVGGAARVRVEHEEPGARERVDGGEEGVAIIATWNGRAIGSTDPGSAAEDIPEGPSVFDLVIELAKAVPVGALLGRLENPSGESSAVMVANAAVGNSRLSQAGLLEVASIVCSDPVAHGIVINAAKTRQPKNRRRLTLTAAAENAKT